MREADYRQPARECTAWTVRERYLADLTADGTVRPLEDYAADILAGGPVRGTALAADGATEAEFTWTLTAGDIPAICVIAQMVIDIALE
jgi:hypothetical protein